MTMIAGIQGSREHPDAERRSAEQGERPRTHAGQASSSARTTGTSTKMPQRPYPIDRIAASSSVTKTSGCLSQPGEQFGDPRQDADEVGEGGARDPQHLLVGSCVQTASLPRLSPSGRWSWPRRGFSWISSPPFWSGAVPPSSGRRE